MTLQTNPLNNQTQLKKSWKFIYVFGGITSLIVLIGIVVDIVLGSVFGENLMSLPQTASGRFALFQENGLLGLYSLDLLNTIIQIVSIPTYFALYAVHRDVNRGPALLALIVFLVGTTVFVTNNAALPMFELSQKYTAATTESQKMVLAAAGEALLARGAHGSLGAFPAFFLPTLAGLMMAFVMLTGKVFGRITSYFGIIGNCLLLVYIVLVTFVPVVQTMAMVFALPGGLMLLAWMILFTKRLFHLSH